MLSGFSLNPALIIVIIYSYHTIIDAHSVDMLTYKVTRNTRGCTPRPAASIQFFVCFAFHHQWMCTNTFCAIMPVLFGMHQSSALYLCFSLWGVHGSLSLGFLCRRLFVTLMSWSCSGEAECFFRARTYAQVWCFFLPGRVTLGTVICLSLFATGVG